MPISGSRSWGAGGAAAFFSHPALIALVVVFAGLVAAAPFTNANLSSGEREDRDNRGVFVAITVLGLLSGYLPAYTDRIGFWTLGGEPIRWLGVVLFAVGGALRIGRCLSSAIGSAVWSPSRRGTH